MRETIKKLISAYRRSGRAMEDLLFRPFSATRWLRLGFLSFLEQLPFAGFLFFSNVLAVAPRMHLLGEHAMLLPVLVFLIPLMTLVGMSFQLSFLYAGSRAAFAYLHMPLKRDFSVGDALAPTARAGFSYFLWRTAFGVLSVASSVFLLGIPAVVLSSSIREVAWAGTGALGLVALAFFLALGFIALLTRDFVVPLMWSRGLSVLAAWKAFQDILLKHLPAFALFYLARLALALLVFLGLLTTGFFTCCVFFLLILIPVAGHALLQPVFLFFRLFPLAFLEEMVPGERFLS